MSSTVFAAVIAAAAMHAGWNALLKVRLDPFLALMLVTSCSGIAALPLLFTFGWPRAEAWPWLLASVAATAAIICGYTLVDGLGARTAGDPHAYSAALFVLGAVPLPLITLWRRGLSGMKPALGFLLPALAGGAMSLGAYWIAIWAMTVAPIALVAALRESSVLFAALIAALVLKEPLAPIRVFAATLILVGLLLIRWH